MTFFYIRKMESNCFDLNQKILLKILLQDFPAEDVGVGPREMGYLFGQYRRLSGHFQV